MIAKRLCFVALSVVIVAPARAAAQAPGFTVDRIFGSRDFTSRLDTYTWTPDGRYLTTTESADGGPGNLVRIEARGGAREVMIGGEDLVPPGADHPIEIESHEFSADGSKVLIFTHSVRVWRDNTKGTYYVWDLLSKKLTPVSRLPGHQMFAKFSPDGRLVGFVRDHNLFVTELASGSETQLTNDGSETIINGTTDWVYEEELGLRDAFRFSPDSRQVAFWRLDQSPIRPFYLLDETALYPTLTPVRYPKAGTPNSEVRLGVIDLATKAIRWVDLGPDREAYIPAMDFANSPDSIWFTRLNRHQNRLELVLADLKGGGTRVAMTDADSAWVETGEPTWIGGGKQFLYVSERDGYAQIFLFRRDGSPVRKLTTGNWDVRRLYGVDEKAGLVYFASAADGATHQTLYRIGLDGKNLTRISGESGTHNAQLDPTMTLYVDTYSRAGAPPIQSLHRADGGQIRVLADNHELVERLSALSLRSPEFIKVPAGDGIDLNGYVIKPRAFDPSRRYPLLMYVYGGPGSQQVTDAWWGSRYLWHQVLAQEGYLVACVDNRGTGGRGSRFKKTTYLNLGVLESADQMRAARYLASLPYVDGSRIGIWGWSYGGYLSSLSMFLGGGIFKAAMAVAPVTDWRFYDTIYTERYMRTPEENPLGYARSAPLAYADSLRGRLLLVHGTGDDNVHAQNSAALIQRLETANKQFDMRFYPSKTHSISGGNTPVNLFGLLAEWVKKNL